MSRPTSTRVSARKLRTSSTEPTSSTTATAISTVTSTSRAGRHGDECVEVGDEQQQGRIPSGATRALMKPSGISIVSVAGQYSGDAPAPIEADPHDAGWLPIRLTVAAGSDPPALANSWAQLPATLLAATPILEISGSPARPLTWAWAAARCWRPKRATSAGVARRPRTETSRRELDGPW